MPAVLPDLPNLIAMARMGNKYDQRDIFDVVDELYHVHGDEELTKMLNVVNPAAGRRLDEEMNDIFSVFAPNNALPHQFQKFSAAAEGTKARAYHEFTRIIRQHVFINHADLDNLRNAVPPSLRAKILFENVGIKASLAFSALDEYVKTGGAGSANSMDVIRCAEELEDLVAVADSNIDQRIINQPENLEAGNIAAKALIDILDGVVLRRGDLYSKSQWPRPQRADEPPHNRDLYLQVFSHRSAARGLFVVDALRKLSAKMIRPHVEALEKVKKAIEDAAGKIGVRYVY
jgi:hypothetical protein